MINNINEFHKLSKAFEYHDEEKTNLPSLLFKYAENFLRKSDTMKAFYSENNLEESFFKEDNLNEKSDIKDVIYFLDNILNKSGLNSASPNNFSYIPSYGVYLSAIADFITSLLNSFPSTYSTSPATVRLENSCIKWICNLIGYPENSGGVFTSGGSMANLIAIIAARDHFPFTKESPKNTVVYYTKHTHHSIHKALKIAGLEDVIKKEIHVDKYFKMKPSHLQETIESDIASGLRPWIVICSAGTTDIGSIDPIGEIKKVTHQFKIWIHIDAAYGGFFILTEKGKQLLCELKLADSITMDPHKSLFLPYGTGSVILKNHSHLLESFAYQANYLRDIESSSIHISPADLSPELSRNSRALRLWIPIKLYGIETFKAALEEKLLLAKYFYTEMGKIEQVEFACEPELSIVTFRYRTKYIENYNKFNELLIKRIQNDGKIYLTSTTINHNIYLRFACLSFKTHLVNIQFAIQIIKDEIDYLIKNCEY